MRDTGALLFRGYDVQAPRIRRHLCRADDRAARLHRARHAANQVEGKVYTSPNTRPLRTSRCTRDGLHHKWPAICGFSHVAAEEVAKPHLRRAQGARSHLARDAPAFSRQKRGDVRAQLRKGIDLPWQGSTTSIRKPSSRRTAQKMGSVFEWREGGILRTRAVARRSHVTRNGRHGVVQPGAPFSREQPRSEYSQDFLAKFKEERSAPPRLYGDGTPLEDRSSKKSAPPTNKPK